MTTTFEVCQWLILERPDILTMAYQMRNSMYVSLDSSATTVIPQPVAAPNNNNQDKVLIILSTYLTCKNNSVNFSCFNHVKSGE